MADNNNPPRTQGAGSGGSGGSTTGTQQGGTAPAKKIAGEFDSVEAAIDKTYNMAKGLEQGFHETREQLGAIRGLLERGLAPVGRGGNGDQGYQRGYSDQQGDGEGEFDDAAFIAQPGKILRLREQRLIARQQQETANFVNAAVSNAMVVARWQARNPDLDTEEGEQLVGMMMKRTNPNDPTTKRLNDAGKMARDYIKSLGGGQGGGAGNGGGSNQGRQVGNEEAGRAASGEEFEPAPAGSGAGVGTAAQQEEEEAGKQGLAEDLEWLAERKRQRAAHFVEKAPK